MHHRPVTPASLLAALALLAAPALAGAEGTLYKWTDENGVVHYGDTVPARYITREREVVNEHAVTMETLPAQKTAEQLAREAELRRAEEQAAQQAAAQAERDRILLNTYLSVGEIEMLRDRRIEALDAQIALTQHYITNLQARVDRLGKLAEPFESTGKPLPDRLSRDVKLARKNLATYQRAMAALRDEQGGIREQFAQDMDRFQALKGVN
ncbi:MAG: DUF4124 domain-containing protein [Pseudomonadota bacterium]